MTQQVFLFHKLGYMNVQHYDGPHELSPGPYPYLNASNSVYMKIFSVIRGRNLFPENLINKYISKYIQTAVKGEKTQLHSDHLETANNCV